MAGFELGDVVGECQYLDRRGMQDGHAALAQLFVRMDLHPSLARFDADFEHRRGVGRVQRLPDTIAFTFFADAAGIAAVIAENFLRPVPRRQVQQEHLRPVQRPIGARRHPHLAEELAVEHRL